jgi:hypothetical protein
MAQLFPPSVDLYAKIAILGVGVLLVGGTYSVYLYVRSPYWTNVGVTLNQPVPFSHQHHAGELGIDCRFCHTSVATSSYAGMPDTQTCMTCHSQIWKDAPMLEPVRQSYAENKPIKWNTVNEMPGYVYFNHSIHIIKGVGCSTCHGRMDEMPITWKATDMTMGWCLACHRNPASNLRPIGEVYQMDWTTPKDPHVGQALFDERNIQKDHLTDCSACHR